MKNLFCKIKYYLSVLSAVLCLLFLSSSNCYSFSPYTNIPKIDPARVEQRLSVPIKKPIKPKIIVPTPEKAAKIPKKDLFRFKLNRIIIKGATVYHPQDFKPFYAQYLGKRVNIMQLKEIAQAITRKYRNDGYILSRAIIPAQHVKQGIVYVRVIEGYVDHVSIQGKITQGVKKLLNSYGRKIELSRPLQLKVLERYVLLANDLSGIRIKTIIAPSKTRPYAANLTFIVKQKRLAGMLDFNNYGTRYLGPNQAGAVLQGMSLFGTADSLGARIVETTSHSEVRFAQLYYHRPLGSNGLYFDLSADYTDTFPGFILKPLNLKGESRSIKARLGYPVVRSRRENLNLFMDFQWLNSLTKPKDIFYEDRIRSLRLGADYSFVDKFFGVNRIEYLFSKGLPVFGASSRNPTIPLSRAGGRSDYVKVNLKISRLQKLGRRFSSLFSIDGQHTNNPLLSAEEFGFGGRDYGRGYDSSEFTGDKGVAAKVEFRCNTHPNFKFFKAVQYYMFYDIGKVWNIGEENQQIRSISGASAGVGMRISFTRYINGELELARPLTAPAQTEELAGRNGKAFRGYFNVNAYF